MHALTQPINKIQLITQQSLLADITAEKTRTLCAPTCMYMLAKAYGGLTDTTFLDYVLSLRPIGHTANGWSRVYLSENLRKNTSFGIVTWWLGANGLATRPDNNFVKMIQSKYISTEPEIEIYKNLISGAKLSSLVDQAPLIVTVKPGFAKNKERHAIILISWSNGLVEIIDPDDRNGKTTYSEQELIKGLHPQGSGTLIFSNS